MNNLLKLSIMLYLLSFLCWLIDLLESHSFMLFWSISYSWNFVGINYDYLLKPLLLQQVIHPRRRGWGKRAWWWCHTRSSPTRTTRFGRWRCASLCRRRTCGRPWSPTPRSTARIRWPCTPSTRPCWNTSCLPLPGKTRRSWHERQSRHAHGARACARGQPVDPQEWLRGAEDGGRGDRWRFCRSGDVGRHQDPHVGRHARWDCRCS